MTTADLIARIDKLVDPKVPIKAVKAPWEGGAVTIVRCRKHPSDPKVGKQQLDNPVFGCQPCFARMKERIWYLHVDAVMARHVWSDDFRPLLRDLREFVEKHKDESSVHTIERHECH